MFDILLTVVHIVIALFMILVVLVQGGNSGGIGAALGGSNTGGVFGASGATTLLGRLTYFAAIGLMVTSLTLTIRMSNAGKTGLIDKVSGSLPITAPVNSDSAPAVQEGTPAVDNNKSSDDQ